MSPASPPDPAQPAAGGNPPPQTNPWSIFAALALMLAFLLTMIFVVHSAELGIGLGAVAIVIATEAAGRLFTATGRAAGRSWMPVLIKIAWVLISEFSPHAKPTFGIPPVNSPPALSAPLPELEE